jgi:hypothetical protein
MTNDETTAAITAQTQTLAAKRAAEKAARAARLDAEEAALKAIVAILAPVLPLDLRDARYQDDDEYLAEINADGTWDYCDSEMVEGQELSYEERDIIHEYDDGAALVRQYRNSLATRDLLNVAGRPALSKILSIIHAVLKQNAAEADEKARHDEHHRVIALETLAAIRRGAEDR